MVQFTQLNLLSPSSPDDIKSIGKKKLPANYPTHSYRKKSQSVLSYLAFDDDYFWELISKDYTSAWKYVARMTRSL